MLLQPLRESVASGWKPGGLTWLRLLQQRAVGSSISLVGLRTYQIPASITHRSPHRPHPPQSPSIFFFLYCYILKIYRQHFGYTSSDTHTKREPT
ncbi:hypothetical protein Q5P01_002718 [Channa striata]|uniref:Uncharacterized protein n=1 Tax=Channa striata TaxID=64152 RepID=A0AA88NPQ4_CHASR|nr:hypothetical protein Q5P01_002718 [Channa striata]